MKEFRQQNAEVAHCLMAMGFEVEEPECDNGFDETPVTSTFFSKEDGYTALVAAWKAAVNDKEAPFEPSSAELLAYAILRGKDWRKGFTPITRERKLNSGSFAVNDGAARALYSLRAAFRSAIFTPFVHVDAYPSIEKLIDLAATRNLLVAGNEMESVPAYPGKQVAVAA